MSELVNVVSIDNPYLTFPMDRKKFYEEQVEEYNKNGKVDKAVEVVDIFLFNSNGQIILQKRASNKNHNPDLIDKSIGGHVNYGNTSNYTVMLETVQELQVPSIVLNSDEDFNKTFNLLKDYTSTIAIIKHFSTQLTFINKIINKNPIEIGHKSHCYVGIYNGSVRNVDKEAKGVLFYYIDELEEEIKKFPEIFTNDLKELFIKNKTFLKEFIENIKK